MIRYFCGTPNVEPDVHIYFTVDVDKDPDAIVWNTPDSGHLIQSLNHLKTRSIIIVEISEDEWLLRQIK
tara:strand:- start:540 stop:746 length:207 start_codon:yes stop_codon:yes gene_type:complete